MNIDQLSTCIYCNEYSEKLTDEHIIPLGLGGSLILKKCSCYNCNSITSRFENFILRGHWLATRKRLNMGSRRKNQPVAPMKAILIKADGSRISGTVPLEECFFQLIFDFYEPELLYREIIGGVKPYAKSASVLFIKEKLPKKFTDDTGRKQNVSASEKIEFLLHEFTAENFFRFLAKVAHSFVIYQKGVNACKTYFLPNIILGNTKDAMKYIGTASQLAQGVRLTKIDRFHSLQLLETKNYLTVLIQLFNIADHDVQPIYQVIVGER